jgi:SEC-C motif-containing protein
MLDVNILPLKDLQRLPGFQFKMVNASDSCPCRSGKIFSECCGPFLAGESVSPTAETLMRSRFSAFQLRNPEYLQSTWDPVKRPKHLCLEQDARTWSNLEVVKTVGGADSDERGVVEFKAKYELGEDTYLFHEISRFTRHDGRWFYLDGTFPFHGKIAHRGKPLRNAPCPCGSGIKHKKCCGG